MKSNHKEVKYKLNLKKKTYKKALVLKNQNYIYKKNEAKSSV
jgi:hypothetical protein